MTDDARWRTGRKVGRTIYIHQGDEDDGRLIGMMDTPELAAFVVEVVNRWLELDREHPSTSAGSE